ncbi:hypothetical protein [Actinophytocola oryzae]|uniref:Uncharacterized protein n=1 Tax=Actinophytocola oryzae TaxID=502181 RepID=A0A4V3FQA3_9PSEU|nr:hypothetical protein [Actinophytocola oryzae]TDV36871.1 hypothetical protein CLV71_13077 [Actinophytocola oryzae]
MRHSDRAVQMPTSASGNRLCRHSITGGCSRWCSYKKFAKVMAGTILLLAALGTALWFAGSDDDRARVRDVAYGMGLYLVVVVPGILILNNREREPD